MSSFKRILALLLLLVLGLLTRAADAQPGSSGPRPYRDAWGNPYKTPDNFWKDRDRDGVINYYDYNDRNRNVQTPQRPVFPTSPRGSRSPYRLR